MKLKQLRYFKTICEYNNITQAASVLHVSQPSLSATIKEMENEFGVVLFYRMSKGLVLTKEGAIFLEATEELLKHADEFAAQMSELGQSSHHIRLGVSPMLSTIIYPSLLQSFQRNLPKTELHIVENGSITNKKLLAEGKLDAAVVSGNEPIPAPYEGCQLFDIDVVYYVSPKNKLSKLAAVDIPSLDGEPLAFLSKDTFLTAFVCQKFHDVGLTPNAVCFTNQIAAISNMVKTNAASCLLFDGVLEESRHVVRVPVNSIPPVRISLLWKKSRSLPTGIQNLISIAKMEFPDHRWHKDAE